MAGIANGLKAFLPASAKRLARAVRALSAQEVSLPLPEEAVEDCRFCASRGTLLDRLPKGGLYCEVGTQYGHFARAIVERCRPAALHVIDIDFSGFDPSGLPGDIVTPHQGRSVDILNGFADGMFDVIYIDGDHSYEGAIGDARASAPKLKPGGYLVFNDFAHISPDFGRFGVHRAVVDFYHETKWPFVLFAYEVKGLYDIALRKPD